MSSDLGHRRDIEGLRALAVGLVVLYHARIGPFGGGFVGVDVFFVISGFLITRLLVVERVRSGRLSLSNFWARRIRRLLPASAVVIVATLLAGRWMLDPLASRDLTWDAVWSGLFSVNVAFAVRGVDYLRAGLGPSPLRHYWSLSVEEQFYLVWPVLVAVTGWWAVKRRIALRTSLAAVVGLGWAGSFVASVVLTPSSPTSAYYLLGTRAWELLTGAAVALLSPRLAGLGSTVRAGAGWCGLVAIVVAAVSFNEQTVFPGWAASLPVLGTAAVIGAGALSAPHGPRMVLDVRPLQWIGARSYAIYLWHWPALVLVEARSGPLAWPARIAVVLGAVVVAELSGRFIENPIRHSVWLTRPVLRSYALGAMAVASVVVVATFLLARAPTLSTAAVAPAATLAAAPAAASATSTTTTTAPPIIPTASTPAQPSAPLQTQPVPTQPGATQPTIGPRQVLEGELASLIAANQPILAAAAQTSEVPANLRPSLRAARGDKPPIYDNGCILDPGQVEIRPCVFGVAGSETVVVLYGDSHAAQWFTALENIAVARGWEVRVMTKKRCPSSAIPTVEMTKECMTWRDNVVSAVAALHPDLVVMSGYRYRSAGWAVGMDSNAAWKRGMDDIVGRLRPNAAQLLILGDSPTPVADIPGCLAGNLRAVTACRMSRAEATRPKRLAVEREVAAAHGVVFIPTSDWLCTEQWCPVIVGDVLAYRDDSHITSAAADLLAPYLDLATRIALSTATPSAD